MIFQERLLVVDNDKEASDLLLSILEHEGLVVCASNAEQALDRIDEDYCAAVITAIDLPVIDGIEFYRRAVEKYPNIGRRFLFLVDETELDKHLDFFEANDLKYRIKTPLLDNIRKAVTEILSS